MVLSITVFSLHSGVSLLVQEIIIHNEPLLLRRIAAGDEKAYTEVYEAYHPSLVSCIIRIVKVKQVAEDISNEIFLNLWQNRHNIDAVQSLNAYLSAAARNRGINALKAMARSSAAMNEVQQAFPQKSIDTETHLLSKEYLDFIKKEIANLPPRAKQVFILCREHGLSYDEVAARLGISRNAVKGHMVASMKRLRTFAEKDLGVPLTFLLLLFTLS